MLLLLARTRDLEPGVFDLDCPVRREGPDTVDCRQAQADRAGHQGGISCRLACGVGRVEALHGWWGWNSRALPEKRQAGGAAVEPRRKQRATRQGPKTVNSRTSRA